MERTESCQGRDRDAGHGHATAVVRKEARLKGSDKAERRQVRTEVQTRRRSADRSLRGLLPSASGVRTHYTGRARLSIPCSRRLRNCSPSRSRATGMSRPTGHADSRTRRQRRLPPSRPV